jgi:uncharacterized protein (TIGR04255 family)
MSSVTISTKCSSNICAFRGIALCILLVYSLREPMTESARVISPLRQAVCEIRFPGDPEVEVQRGAFYRSIRHEFPLLLVPYLEQGQAVALQHYRFKAHNDRWLALATNSLVYSVPNEDYESFVKFKNGFKNYVDLFRKVYLHMEGFTRVSLRYVNHLPVSRGVEGEITFIPTKLPTAVDGQVQNTLHVAEYQLNGGLLRVAIDTTQEDLSPKLALLDFDFSYNADVSNVIPISELENRLDSAHKAVKDSLYLLITDDYAQEAGITWP